MPESSHEAIRSASQEPAARLGGSSPRVQLRRELAGMSYEAQMNRVSPDHAVQMMPAAPAVQLAGGSGGTPVKASDTHGTTPHKKFVANVTGYLGKVDLPVDNAAIDEAWDKIVQFLIDSKPEFATIPKLDEQGNVDPSAKFLKLSDAAYQKLAADLSALSTALDTYFDAFVKDKSTWAFWSGTGAKEMAQASGAVVLESTAFGAPFEKVGTMVGPEDFTVWGAFSTKYAQKAAEKIKGRTFVGFVGPGAGRTENVFNQIEQKTFVKLCKAKHQVVPPISWSGVATEAFDNGKGEIWGRWDSNYPGPAKGAAAVGDRGTCVAAADKLFNDRKNALLASTSKSSP